MKNCPGCGVPEPGFHKPGCLQKVVDDYLLMERKAKAWDELLITARCAESSISGQALAAKMDRMVKPPA